MDTVTIQHVLVPVTDLEKARAFYGGLLGLHEVARPAFHLPGAWYQLAGGHELHLIVSPAATQRGNKGLDDCDTHFALRVKSYWQTLELFRSHGYSEEAPELDGRKMMVRERSARGYSQIFVMDPDRNVIEFNAELDVAESDLGDEPSASDQ